MLKPGAFGVKKTLIKLFIKQDAFHSFRITSMKFFSENKRIVKII